MDFRKLRYFGVLARELHFGRAAALLHIAQPALSQQIKALEADLGVPLFKRHSRAVELTEAGHALQAEADDLLMRCDRIRQSVGAAAAGIRGRLRLSTMRSAPEGVASRIVEQFRRQYPDVQLAVDTGFTALNVERVNEGKLDCAFVRPPLYEGGLETLDLGTEPLVIALPRVHPLAARRLIAREQLRDAPVVSGARARGPGFFDTMYRQVWGTRGPNLVMEEADEEQILRAVARGIGLSIITQSRARTLKVQGVVFRSFRPPVPQAGIALAWPPRAAAPALLRFIETARLFASKA